MFVNALSVEDGRGILEALQSLGDGCYLLTHEGALKFDGSTVAIGSEEAAVEAFFNLCDPDVAAASAALLNADPMAPFLTPVTLDTNMFRNVLRATWDRDMTICSPVSVKCRPRRGWAPIS